MPECKKRGAILFIVIGIVMVISFLSVAMLRIISNQSRLTHHQVSRIQALYATNAGMVLALEQLRTGNWSQDPLVTRYYCINGPVDAGVFCTETLVDAEIRCGDLTTPCNVQIAVCPPGIVGAPCNVARILGTQAMIRIKTDYTYLQP